MENDNSVKEKNLKRERTIFNISFVFSALFILAEVICALQTKSNVLIMDSIYDLIDLILIGPFLLLIPLLYIDVNEKHPYGYSQVESVLIMIKSLVLFIVTVLLAVNSFLVILDGGNSIDVAFIANFQFFVSITCCIIYIVLSKLSKGIGSPSLDAELYVWKLDSLSTMGVCIAFALGSLLKNTSLSFIVDYIDPGITILLSIFLVREPIGLFIESLRSIILFAPDKETFDNVKTICTKYITKYRYLVNFCDVIITGRKIWVGVYITNEEDLISVHKMKTIKKLIEDELKESFDSVFVYITPELEEITLENKKKLKERRRLGKLKSISKMKKEHV